LFAYANRAKINFDVTNSSNDMWRMFWTWRKFCF
jgi:hypothetical protein